MPRSTRSDLRTHFHATLDRLVALGAPWPGAVAFSGGSDSLALLNLVAGWARRKRKPAPVALIVDHGLRAGSHSAARAAARAARALGVKAHILKASGARPERDIEAAAREMRYRLMGDWLAKHGRLALYVGHTRDDQAETLLLRLARGSGLDGLSAMKPLSSWPVAGYRDLVLVRPLLGFEKTALRDHLAAGGHDWLEDPMNRDPRFSRVRLRDNWPALESLGLTTHRVANAAHHLARAREALDWVTLAILARAARVGNDGTLVDSEALIAAPRELGLRALAAILAQVSGQAYRPRFEQLERLFDRLSELRLKGGVTLHGCRIGPAPKARALFGPGTIEIARERGRPRR